MCPLIGSDTMKGYNNNNVAVIVIIHVHVQYIVYIMYTCTVHIMSCTLCIT